MSTVLAMALSVALMTSGCDTPEVESIFSSIPGEILFVSPDSTGTSQLFSMNADGGDVRQISHGSDFPIVGAVWSPDGRHIALLSMKGWVKFYGPALYLVDSDGSNLRQLLRGSAPNAASGNYPLVWSPDSRKLAFHRLLAPEALGIYKTFITGISGQEVAPLTDDLRTEQVSDWKTDGSALLGHVDGLAFDSLDRRIDYRYLTLWSAEDGQSTQLLGNPGEGFSWPKWSPDESHIVFTFSQDGKQNLHVAKEEGSHMRAITENQFEFITPVAWSTDGNTVLANGRIRNGDGELIRRVVIVDVDGRSVSDISPFPNVDNIPTSWLGND